MKRVVLGLPILLVCAPFAAAAPPEPLDHRELFAFPGASVNAPSAASAGLALADRWLGDEPFWNPASAPRRGVMLAPVLLHPSRQDLRADNRNFDETAAFFDGAGGWIAGAVGPLGVAVYGHQPVLRREDNAFEQGPLNQVPAVLASRTTSRETRGGVALSYGFGPARLGAAAEFVGRNDSYEYEEVSGVPNPGLRTLDFDGSAVGFAAGATVRIGAPAARGLEIGAAVRQIPELEADAELVRDVAAGDTAYAFTITRESAIEGGVSLRWHATEAFALIAGVGTRGEQAWEGLDLVSPSQTSWSVAMSYHDARDPWTLRFGLGQEKQNGAPEPEAGVIGLGIGWKLEGATTLDLGVLRRSLERDGAPTSYDDRVVAGVHVAF